METLRDSIVASLSHHGRCLRDTLCLGCFWFLADGNSKLWWKVRNTGGKIDTCDSCLSIFALFSKTNCFRGIYTVPLTLNSSTIFDVALGSPLRAR